MVFPRLVLDAVNRATSTLDGAAGKAINTAKVLHTLGADARVVGFLGGERGAHLRDVLAAQSIGMDFLEVPVPTRQCITVIDQAAGTITELVEESRAIPPSEYDGLLFVIRRHLPNCGAMVLSGTITPGGPMDFYMRCVQLAKETGCLAVVDAQRELLLESLPAKPDLVKPNRTELAATLALRLADETAVLRAMRELHNRGAQGVVVTDGKNPTLAFDGTKTWRIHAPDIHPVNPIGSGDACTAALVWRLVRGEELGEACRWGAAAGAANALTLMAGDVSRADVERLVEMVKLERIA